MSTEPNKAADFLALLESISADDLPGIDAAIADLEAKIKLLRMVRNAIEPPSEIESLPAAEKARTVLREHNNHPLSAPEIARILEADYGISSEGRNLETALYVAMRRRPDLFRNVYGKWSLIVDDPNNPSSARNAGLAGDAHSELAPAHSELAPAHSELAPAHSEPETAKLGRKATTA